MKATYAQGCVKVAFVIIYAFLVVRINARKGCLLQKAHCSFLLSYFLGGTS